MTSTDLILIVAAVMCVGLDRPAWRQPDLVGSLESLAYTIAAFVAVKAMSPAVAPWAFCILTAVWISDYLAQACKSWRDEKASRRD